MPSQLRHGRTDRALSTITKSLRPLHAGQGHRGTGETKAPRAGRKTKHATGPGEQRAFQTLSIRNVSAGERLSQLRLFFAGPALAPARPGSTANPPGCRTASPARLEVLAAVLPPQAAKSQRGGPRPAVMGSLNPAPRREAYARRVPYRCFFCSRSAAKSNRAFSTGSPARSIRFGSREPAPSSSARASMLSLVSNGGVPRLAIGS